MALTGTIWGQSEHDMGLEARERPGGLAQEPAMLRAGVWARGSLAPK